MKAIDFISEEEEENARLYADAELFNKFCRDHRVEVVLGYDFQYWGHIDGEVWSTSFTPFNAMLSAIRKYKNHLQNVN